MPNDLPVSLLHSQGSGSRVLHGLARLGLAAKRVSHDPSEGAMFLALDGIPSDGVLDFRAGVYAMTAFGRDILDHIV